LRNTKIGYLYNQEKGQKRAVINTIMNRPLCICGFRPAAVNYIKNGKTYYRKKCETCLRYNGTTVGIPKWFREGYRQKLSCDKCGFKSKYKEQFNVYHIDGNLNNCRTANLKTVCANCQRVLHKEHGQWRQGDLQPDF
jgi:hypothetical protein